MSSLSNCLNITILIYQFMFDLSTILFYLFPHLLSKGNYCKQKLPTKIYGSQLRHEWIVKGTESLGDISLVKHKKKTDTDNSLAQYKTANNNASGTTFLTLNNISKSKALLSSKFCSTVKYLIFLNSDHDYKHSCIISKILYKAISLNYTHKNCIYILLWQNLIR